MGVEELQAEKAAMIAPWKSSGTTDESRCSAEMQSAFAFGWLMVLNSSAHVYETDRHRKIMMHGGRSKAGEREREHDRHLQYMRRWS
jgi:hypothetical protein